MNNIEAITGLSSTKYRKSQTSGYLLPHNWDGAPLSEYQQAYLSRYQYFWFSTVVISHLSRHHPVIAKDILKQYEGTEAAIEYVDFKSAAKIGLLYAVNQSISDKFNAATGIYLESDDIASIAWNCLGVQGKKTLNGYLIKCKRQKIDPYFQLKRDLSGVLRLIGNLRTVEELDDAVTYALDKPEGVLLGWNRRSIDYADAYAVGYESEDELILLADSLIPIALLDVIKIVD